MKPASSAKVHMFKEAKNLQGHTDALQTQHDVTSRPGEVRGGEKNYIKKGKSGSELFRVAEGGGL